MAVALILLGFIAGLICGAVFWRISSNDRASLLKRERDKARKVLAAHGLKTDFYLPAVGAPEGSDLFRALDEFQGMVVTDKDGRIVGKLVSAAALKTPKLKLVVSNDSD